MGYRSDFKLICAGTKAQVDELLDSMREYVAQPDWLNEHDTWYGEVGWYRFIYTEGRVQGPGSNSRGLYGFTCELEGVKCYGSFETVISRIVDYARNELEMDCAWARVGDDTSDMEESQGESVSVNIIRSLGDFDW